MLALKTSHLVATWAMPQAKYDGGQFSYRRISKMIDPGGGGENSSPEELFQSQPILLSSKALSKNQPSSNHYTDF